MYRLQRNICVAGGLRCRFLAAVVVAVLVVVPLCEARAIDVDTRNTRWGFDGQIVPGEFNPVSILVDNPTPNPFDGELRLSKSMGGRQVGATLVEPIYLAPFTRRWVQFYPFVQHEWEEWTVSYRPGGGRLQLPQAKLKQPSTGRATIFLDEQGTLGLGSGNLRRFNEELFPPVVAATGGLGTVVLDHLPRWEKGRRQSFLDWIYRGGRLHLIHGADGEYPKFSRSGILAELNTPLEKFRIGAGTVYRHPRTRSTLEPQFVREVIRNELAAANKSETEETETDVDAGQVTYDSWNNGEINFSELNQQFLQSLKGMTRADHNWPLIHLMSISYILLIFPGCWLLGRGRRDYRLVLGALLAAMAMFSLGFHVVGRRGYGESTAVHSIALARPLSDGDYDVMQWSNVFVTNGDMYSITHDGRGRLYSTAQENERVNGIIRNTLNGRMLVDIPPFSSREVVSRFKAQGPPLRLTVQSWQHDGERLNLVVATGPDFPAQTYGLYALHRGSFYNVYRREDRLELGKVMGTPTDFLRYTESDDYGNYGRYYQNDRLPKEIFDSKLRPLIARHLGLNSQQEADKFSLPDDRVRLFVYAPLPEQFQVRYAGEDEGPVTGRQEGRVLYCIDLFNPEEP